MRPLIQLPKNAIIKKHGYDSLIIRDHLVVSHVGFLAWMLPVFEHDYNQSVVPQMIQQGVRFDAFINYCITELQDVTKTGWWTWYLSGGDREMDIEKFSSGRIGTEIRTEFIKKLRQCKNWKQFGVQFLKNGEWDKLMCDKINKAARQ